MEGFFRGSRAYTTSKVGTIGIDIKFKTARLRNEEYATVPRKLPSKKDVKYPWIPVVKGEK